MSGKTPFIERARRSVAGRFHRARSLAAIVSGDVRGRLFRRAPSPQRGVPAIYPVYFTCAADFDFIRLSIRSLTTHAAGRLGRIHVYEDRNQPLSARQKADLANDTPIPIAFRRTRAPMAWGGVTLLHNELRAFIDLAHEIGPRDFIVKIDSDVLFTAGWLFPTVLDADADLIGQPVSSIPTISRRAVPDVQGGCYFLRAGALPRLRSASLLAAARQVARTTRYDLWRVPEDRTVSQWAHDAGLRVRFTDFYLLDLTPLRNSPLASDAEVAQCLEQESPFAVIHFERCKERMASCYARLFRHDRDTPSQVVA